jgi:DNA-directed RNA polymerase specialized sigma24 family protein
MVKLREQVVCMSKTEWTLGLAEVDLVEPTSDAFGKAFPHLVPGVLRRQHSAAHLKDRALVEIRNLAILALKSLHWDYNRSLVEDAVEMFVQRVFGHALLEKHDPTRGEMGAFMYGIMRRIILECLRERARQRIENRDQSGLRDLEPEPGTVAESKERIEHLRLWTIELPPAQRNAVARRFDVLGDLDTGGVIPNEAVARHRGLKKLRQKANVLYGAIDTG